ncbi:dipeptidyl-aminopeptidase B-like protein [Emericellopsis cladophorae]|uniref:Probable dipeptidyl-aminopeptidase B n=1 Tax=Emericellopsis cladophorae TaxID=2686198 RepID=A0A9Q0BGS3_9HYPO|nr:dipeptidyl-aminopeptidase B-like protein [Emericellopsis cladophorae]KAI6784807.1 dipeptidyl-aminopeptidase B-like protein [Emericellopsis cladophorae]
MPPVADVDTAKPRASHESLSSASTTSLVFERIQERNEKQAHPEKDEKGHGHDAGYDDLDDQDPLREPAEDLETGPFLGDDGNGASQLQRARRQPMDKKMRRILIAAFVVFCLGWFVSLAVFVAKGSYKHLSDVDHDPDASSRGSGKSVTLDQVLGGFWNAKQHSISWIANPEGQDGLYVEQGTAGKDFLVVEHVRSQDEDKDKRGEDIPASRTLMKEASFQFGDETFRPAWTKPSPDLKRVLLGVNKEKNWRHSFMATYFILDVASQKVEPLVPLDAQARVQLAQWNPQSDAIAFTRDDNNLYIRHLQDGRKENKVTQVTHNGGAEYFNGVPDWVYEEEVLHERIATWWSADGGHLAFLQTNETGVPEYPVQYFLSRPSGTEPPEGEERYPEVRQIKYPKAGAHNPVVQVRYYNVDKDEVFSVDADKQFPDDDRVVNHLVWAGNDKAIIKQTNRISDVLKVVLVDVGERKAHIVRERDVGKEDGGWFELSHHLAYVPADGKNGREHDGYVDSVIHDGYDHIAYFTPLNNPDPIMLTSGQWEVEDAPSSVDLVNNLVYFKAAKESSIQRHVYSVSLLDGSNLECLTDPKTEAYYDAYFSTESGYTLLTYHGPKTPYQKIITTPSLPKDQGPYERTIEENRNLADQARRHALPVLSYGTLDLPHGISVNYLERRPPHFNPSKSYPILFQQYSGPGSQQVTKKFRVDFQSYVASSLGYIVVTVDPRGTGFKGRDHRVGVRGQLGVLEAEDHIAAAQHFASLPHVDETRLAIWGWSYGGFTTLKTLEQDAGQTYAYGVAVAPVTDWRFYDSVYAERYMRLPKDNKDGYDESSVHNATALGENVRFLLMHGVADDNVHFQNSLTLLDALDLAGVENYDVHVFPDSDHGIYFHQANRIVFDKITNWLINAFNGEWLTIKNPKPIDK